MSHPGRLGFGKLYTMFAPPGFSCLGCGKWTRHSAGDYGYPELCPSCAEAIPWIRDPRCPVCGRGIGCPDCTRGDWAQHRPFIMNRSAVTYDERMRDWLGQYKYRGRERLASVLGRMTVQGYIWLEQEMRRVTGDRRWRIHIITYVPVSPPRMRERGFNQAEVLAAAVAGKVKMPLLPLLQRTRDTEKQSLKSRSERLKDMRSAFAGYPEGVRRLGNLIQNGQGFRNGTRFGQSQPLRLLLVDDIYTTGSTAGACGARLHDICASIGVQAEVYSLTWARS
ncbi:ComF family protein [Paenibacillus caui]|uniref:ComF family protein n=1 Tax=Paenibacillus caui TaxID=2873927 RepID=UPI001CA7E389|nr:ComF family protein [Paenibacillus caui]